MNGEKSTVTATQPQKTWRDLVQERRTLFTHHQPPQHSQQKLIEQQQHLLQSTGGQLDQMYAYLEQTSALDWLAIDNHTQYVHSITKESMGIWAAKLIKNQLKDMGYADPPCVSIFAMGCGGAKKDILLLEALVEEMPSVEKFFMQLLDINPILLENGYNHTKNIFRDEPRVEVSSVLGNMYQLSMYKELFFNPRESNIPQVVFFIGFTFGNISDEVDFLQNALGQLPPDTLLLVDYTLVFAPSHQTNEILEKEPYFSKNHPKKWFKAMERFYMGPFKRHKEGVSQYTFRPALEAHRARVPGSYHVEFYVDMVFEDGKQENFGVQRVKRYDGELLLDLFEATGFQAIGGQRSLNNVNTELYLFRKK